VKAINKDQIERFTGPTPKKLITSHAVSPAIVGINPDLLFRYYCIKRIITSTTYFQISSVWFRYENQIYY